MKGLSFWQPYGTLVALRKKQWETRCWSTNLRGTIAIHTTKSYPREAAEKLTHPAFKEALASELVTNQEGDCQFYCLPCSAIIAVADIITVITTEDWLECFKHEPQMRSEFEFGDYSPTRFAWKLENIRRLKEPIACTGSQRLWSVSAEIKAQIKEQLGSVTPGELNFIGA